MNAQNKANSEMNNKHARAWGAVSVVLAFAMFSAGFFISSRIFASVGRPPDIFAFLIAVLLGIMLLFFVGNLLRRISPHRGSVHFDGGQQILNALERISSGDFNIMLEWNEHDPFYEIVESVNRMARELGTTEQLRQEFISNVSHEIQSPLTSIGGFAALLKDPALGEADRLHYLSVIETESKRLSKLSENLLKLSALEMDDPITERAVYFPGPQIESAVLLLEPQYAEKDIRFSLSIDRVAIYADEQLINQAWINLIHNALKFSNERGSIELTLRAENGYAVFSIKDDGCGIPEADLPHIFERFYKADKSRDRSVGGNGLGLSLVKKITELHGGSVSVESAQGKGTVFFLRLPIGESVNQNI